MTEQGVRNENKYALVWYMTYRIDCYLSLHCVILSVCSLHLSAGDLIWQCPEWIKRYKALVNQFNRAATSHFLQLLILEIRITNVPKQYSKTPFYQPRMYYSWHRLVSTLYTQLYGASFNNSTLRQECKVIKSNLRYRTPYSSVGVVITIKVFQ